MGIRVNKCIGYGLTDVKTKDCAIVDSRFNSHNYDEFYEKFDLKKWCKILKAKYETEKKKFEANEENESIPRTLPTSFHSLIFTISTIQDMIAKKKTVHAHDLMCHQFEMGHKNVVVFSPLNFVYYNRYDDLIDYCEEREREMRPKVQILKFPIYPFESYMDKRNGESIVYNAQSWTKHHQGKDSVKVPIEFFKGNSIKTLGEARENIVPSVPTEVMEFCEHMNIFKDKNTVFSLKPMIYTYWS